MDEISPQHDASHVGRAVSYAESEADRLGRALEDFSDPSQEWRRLFSELLGTFFLVLVAAGGRHDGPGVPGHDQPNRGRRRSRR